MPYFLTTHYFVDANAHRTIINKNNKATRHELASKLTTPHAECYLTIVLAEKPIQHCYWKARTAEDIHDALGQFTKYYKRTVIAQCHPLKATSQKRVC